MELHPDVVVGCATVDGDKPLGRWNGRVNGENTWWNGGLALEV
eukprot:CAMPEP_0118953680 /NCGR_PEP_ID=MMETSP1169-20130426/56993_1 /TAXON_ID=36882 /ORGANISM="Pyramimonas obovata, Strain CCMP722" /LENGTH=42 /DNA_ID= /DNA_START= /DNA_END= /DNA_ORIENTATION=